MIRHRPGCESTETQTFVGKFGDTLQGCVECRAWTVASPTPEDEAPPTTPTYRGDSITRALHREKAPHPPTGWPTHKHRARNRRRTLAARRRLARREARTTTREDHLT